MSEKKKWFEYAGDDSDVIVSTRVSLSRNLKGRPFVWRMRAEEREEVLGEILAAVGNERLSVAGLFACTRMESLTKTQAVSLAERGLVTPEFIAKREGKALPALLAFYKDSGMYEAYRAAGDPFSTYFDEENLLPGPLKELVRKACASLE